MQTLHDYQLDGEKALVGLILQTDYGCLEQAVASLTLFSHPGTVAQTGAMAIFPIIRNARKRGVVEMRDGNLVGLDDNKAPTDAFLWSNEIRKRPPDIQFNHIYQRSDDPDCYTNLANLCAAPAFLSKLTDTNQIIKTLLQYRAYDLYGWKPAEHCLPKKPELYDELNWCEPLKEVHDLKNVLTTQLNRRRDRTNRIVMQTGWLFGWHTLQTQ